MIRVPASSSNDVSLHSGASVGAAWESVLLPWFKRAAATAWKSAAPTLVVVPFRSHAYRLKMLLIEERVPLLGIHFGTPVELREMFGQQIRLPRREHSRLLMSLAAEQCMALPDDPALRKQRLQEGDFLAAKAVANAPDHLLRAIDQLAAAGWSFSEVGPPELHKLVEKYQELLRRCGFESVHEIDRTALRRAETGPPIFANVLISGFHGAHWPLWPLLRAGVTAATHATVVLTDPRDEARDLDECWVGTWEEVFGSATPIAEIGPKETGPDLEQMHLPFFEQHAPQPLSKLHFLVGSSTNDQAEAIVAIALKFLAEKSCHRLGILLPGAGALARAVAALLARLAIPHDDGIAHLAPGPFEDDAWLAWLELQENPQISVLIRFLRAYPDAEKLFGGLKLRSIEDVLQRALGDLLIDDIAVLAAYCARRTDSRDGSQVAHGLAALEFLPEVASLPGFLSETERIFAHLGWAERWAEVNRLSKSWSSGIDEQFSRHTYLRWLAEVSCSLYPVRDDLGGHPYSRVHLLPYSQAEGQDWSHLILAGLNEGQWPPADDESGFLREEEIEELNQRIKVLNRRVIRQGSQGEGHRSVREGHTLYVGPVQQRQITLRQFMNIVESAKVGLAATASLFHESSPDRLQNPSEFFTRLYFSARGKPLSQGGMEALHNETRTWLQRAELFCDDRATDDNDVQQTRVAYDIRRKPDRPAGKYDFALERPLSGTMSLAATDWENALKAPALVWMKAYLGVQEGETEGDGWSLAIGQWVHRWLAQISGAPGSNCFADLPPSAGIPAIVHAEALRFRIEVQSIVAECRRVLPDWWLSGWGNALYTAQSLGAKLVQIETWPRIATEWRLDSPKAQPIVLDSGEPLRLRGRADLILARGNASDRTLPYEDTWVIDYKTGNRKGLASSQWHGPEERFAGVQKHFRRGDGVQLALYALALRALGAANVGVSLLSRVVNLDSPQLTIADIEAQGDIWRELRRMQETGIFGMRGLIRSEFNLTGAYPLATLAIDFELLEDKWALTHPGFAGEPLEEEE